MIEMVGVEVLTPGEGAAALDAVARRYLGMSGPQFVSAWEAGAFDADPDRPEVMRVAALLPLACKPARRTLFTCHHPESRRWLSSCTWIEGCRECRATRFARRYHADKSWEWVDHWPPAYRYQIVSDGSLLTYDEQDNLVFSQPVG